MVVRKKDDCIVNGADKMDNEGGNEVGVSNKVTGESCWFYSFVSSKVPLVSLTSQANLDR